jgi:RHS repeat-associated protein
MVLDANFGTRSATAIGNSRTYTGRQIDWETGLFYYRNRHYHAQLGGFISLSCVLHAEIAGRAQIRNDRVGQTSRQGKML